MIIPSEDHVFVRQGNYAEAVARGIEPQCKTCGSTQVHHPTDDTAVNHPPHYGGDTVYETIKVIEAWGLGFCLGNAVKYVSRAGKKSPEKTLEDLKKARWYLDREISRLEPK